MKQRYALEFEIEGLPRMSNSLLGSHWTQRAGHAKTWKRKVWLKAWPFKPPEPLAHAELCLVRCSSRPPDSDGLVSGFKSVIDGLVEAGVIKSDTADCIGMPNYKWEKCKQRKGKIKIKVEGVCE